MDNRIARQLRGVERRYKGKPTFTGEVVISDMARDAAAEIEALEAELDAANNLISRAAVWLDLHKAGGLDDVLREFAKHLAAMKEDAHE